MGNQVGGRRRRRPAVDERYTRPQGLYPHPDIDLRKLRRLILEAKLAPCHPGDDDARADLDECPICFPGMFYPSLNRSKCCAKGICTGEYLRMKNKQAATLGDIVASAQVDSCSTDGASTRAASSPQGNDAISSEVQHSELILRNPEAEKQPIQLHPIQGNRTKEEKIYERGEPRAESEEEPRRGNGCEVSRAVTH